MADLRRDAAFVAAVAAARQAIGELASRGNADAAALVQRSGGWNNLQGHAHSIVPLAVFFARHRPLALGPIKGATSLRTSQSHGSREARKRTLWRQVQADLRNLLRNRGSDILAEEMRSNRPQTAQQIANTYLSSGYGGGQTSGGGGDTVLKRTLKLLAHVLLA